MGEHQRRGHGRRGGGGGGGGALRALAGVRASAKAAFGLAVAVVALFGGVRTAGGAPADRHRGARAVGEADPEEALDWAAFLNRTLARAPPAPPPMLYGVARKASRDRFLNARFGEREVRLDRKAAQRCQRKVEGGDEDDVPIVAPWCEAARAVASKVANALASAREQGQFAALELVHHACPLGEAVDGHPAAVWVAHGALAQPHTRNNSAQQPSDLVFGVHAPPAPPPPPAYTPCTLASRFPNRFVLGEPLSPARARTEAGAPLMYDVTAWLDLPVHARALRRELRAHLQRARGSDTPFARPGGMLGRAFDVLTLAPHLLVHVPAIAEEEEVAGATPPPPPTPNLPPVDPLDVALGRTSATPPEEAREAEFINDIVELGATASAQWGFSKVRLCSEVAAESIANAAHAEKVAAKVAQMAVARLYAPPSPPRYFGIGDDGDPRGNGADLAPPPPDRRRWRSARKRCRSCATTASATVARKRRRQEAMENRCASAIPRIAWPRLAAATRSILGHAAPRPRRPRV